MPALLILCSTAMSGERVEGDCPGKGVGYYMKNGFSSELF